MSEFINTRASIGEQATVDGLVDRSLTELKEDSVSVLETYSLYKNTALQSVEFPGITNIKSNALDGCTGLTTCKLGGYESTGALTIAANAFNGCTNLTHLLIDRPAMATLSATSAFTGTKIALGNGAIYVPESLLATYKANANWKNYFIAKLADYPRSNFDSIEDSWADIIANSDYATDYAVGDSKTISVNGSTAKMVLAAKDTDVKSSDHESKARMTWICHGIPFTHRMNATSTTSGGWAESEMRSWLRSDILTTLPAEVQAAIVEVDKTYRCKSPNDETLTIADTIWIPSDKEVGFTAAAYVEDSGVVYSGLFGSNVDRIKYNTSGSASVWWLRSAYSATGFSCVSGGGGSYSGSASLASGVVFGFCI